MTDAGVILKSSRNQNFKRFSFKTVQISANRSIVNNETPRKTNLPLSRYIFFYDRPFLSIDHRVLFYNAYIKPHLDYYSLIWSNTSNVNINKITKLQRRSCKLILGQEYNGLIEALERLNMLSFDQSIFLSKAKLMYKIQNNLAPAYLNEMFLMRDITLNNTASNLRSVTNKNLLVSKAKCNLFKGSLSYSGVIY